MRREICTTALPSARRTLAAAMLWLFAAAGPAALAQARFAGTGPGAPMTLGGTASGFQTGYGNRLLGGGTVFLDLNPRWRYGFEGEARMLRLHQLAETHESTFLAGPRISFGRRRLNPYGKVLAGLGRFNFPNNSAYGNYFVVAAGAGVDYRLSPRLKLRLIDFEYQDWPGFTFGTIHPYGVSCGISVAVLRGRSRRE